MANSVHNLLFLHPMKTGGSSIYRLLEQHGYRSFRYDHKRIDEVEKQIGKKEFDDKFKVLFCRNPYDRLVSFFFFCAKAKQSHAYDTCSKAQRFNKWVIQEGDKVAEWCWPVSDYYWLRDTKVVDYVGRFETFGKDVKYLVKDILGKEGVALPHIQRTDAHRQSYQTYYTSESKEIVKRAFAKDFELFDYNVSF